MKKYVHKRLNERYFKEILPNGLTVYLFPKPKYTSTVGYLITKFGSCDTEFIPSSENNFCQVPNGVAHFLEHKLFESPDGIDAGDVFEQLGASYNAYTTYDRTIYYFSTTSSVQECIDNLLNLAQTPYFTDESTEKEKAIIAQEIAMYANKPGNVMFNQLASNLYFEHPCKFEIGGTPESITQINANILYKCYNTFYHPSNMALAIVGNINVDEIVSFIRTKEEKLTIPRNKGIVRKLYQEPSKVVAKETTSSFDIMMPKVGCAIKVDMTKATNIRHYKDINLIDCFLDYYFGESSSFYQKMLKEEVIDRSFSYGSDDSEDYFYLYFIGNTNKVEEFKKGMLEQIEIIKKSPFPIDEFNRRKKLILSANVSKYNVLEYIAETICNLYISQIELFEGSNIKEELSLDDINNLRDYFEKDMTTFHIMYPLKKGL